MKCLLQGTKSLFTIYITEYIGGNVIFSRNVLKSIHWLVPLSQYFLLMIVL